MNAYQLSPDSDKTAYPHLLDWAERNASIFHLVLRHGLDFNAESDDMLALLSPFIVRDRKTWNWAGTVAHDEARVIEYKVSKESMGILRRAGGVFSWIYPFLPEDLAFFGPDMSCLFNSVSHHEEAWICDKDLKSYLDSVGSIRITESNFTVRELTFSDAEKK